MTVPEPVIFDTQKATVTVSPLPEGWSVIGVSKLRSATFTAQIPACGCGQLSCRYGWHEKRTLTLAGKISRTYL